MKQALIIFVRHPELGKVKTRLAASLGDKAALNIYKKLLQHTFHISQVVEADKFIFYADKIIEEDMWQLPRYFKAAQATGDLGVRMLAAFREILGRGYQSACIIGSDCYDLSATIIEEAFGCLEKNDMVIGPALDGGYYLLGMNDLYTDIFQCKKWSTDTVFFDTIQDFERLDLAYEILQPLRDIDDAEDLPANLLE